MVAAANMVEVAALVGDTARATMLAALMGGQALTASELAARARISKSTASGHLTRLVGARLLAVTQKRRKRYYRIASPRVARVLGGIKAVAAIEVPARYQRRSVQDDRLRFARTCYDHLAGYLRRDRRRARCQRPHRPERGWPRADRFRRTLPGRLRRRIDGDASQQANFLPAMPRLERAALSHRRFRRRGDSTVLSGARLA